MLLPSDFLLHNRYLIKSHIGQGGFGITYIAYDQQLAVQVCIKELFLGGSSTRSTDMSVQSQSLEAGFSFQDFVERFLDEARQLARFKHPNIVRVTDVFKENNTAYMVMDFVEGETLQSLVKRKGALPESKALALLGQVLDAVEEVHKKGMLHRDIKPENILVTAEGTVVLIDFGSAREFAEGKTTTQTAMITPGYAPIEQYSNRAQRGTYTDIYALGATLYYMITGQKPIPATYRNLEMLVSPHELNNQISPQLSSAVMMAMAMKPEDRFQGIGDVRQAISLFKEHQTHINNASETGKYNITTVTNKVPEKKSKVKNNVSITNWIVGLIILVVLALQFLNVSSTNPINPINRKQFEQDMLLEGEVEKVEIVNDKYVEVYLTDEALQLEEHKDVAGSRLGGVSNPGPHYSFQIGDAGKFEEDIEDLQAQTGKEKKDYISISYATRTDWLGQVLSWVVPILILVVIWMFIIYIFK